MRLLLPRRVLAGCLVIGSVAALLVGCVSRSARYNPAPQAPAPEPEAATETASICPKPSEALACVVVRPRGQLGLKPDGSDTYGLEHWRDRVGIPLEQVDRFGVVVFDDQWRRALIVRTKTPIDEGTVRVVLAARKKVAGSGKKAVYVARNGLAIHFPEPTLAVIADNVATMAACKAEMGALTAHPEWWAPHDLNFWVRTTPVAEGEGRHTCCKAVGPIQIPLGGKPGCSLFGTALPVAAKSARLSVDVGAGIDLTFAVRCDDEASARQVARALGSFLDMARGGMLLMSGQLDLMTGFAEEESAEAKKIQEMVPHDLVHPVEKALGQATVKAGGRSAVLHARLPVSGKRLGVEAKKLLALANVKGEKLDGPGLFFGLPAEEAAQDGPRASDKVPVAPTYPDPPPAPPSASLGSSPPSPMSAPVCPPTEVLPQLVPAAEAGKVVLSVGNCRKEKVLLFRLRAHELVFVREVEPGEAVDVPTVVGERWAAVFMNAPHQVQHIVTGGQPVWLLRNESETQPTPCGQGGLQAR